MATPFLRRAAALAVTILCAAVLEPLALSSPADAESSEGKPAVPRADAAAVAAGGFHTCAIVADGSVRCWGDNDYGQLGQGNTDDIGNDPGESTVAVDLGPGRTAVAVAAGQYHTCAVLDTGQLRCWGDNDYGQLGQGNTEDIGDTLGETTVAVDLGPGRTAVAVAAGESQTCAVLDTGQLRCWGRNDHGQLGQGTSTGGYANIGDEYGETTVAVDLGQGRTAAAVSAGSFHTCAVLDTGQLRCWGRNNYGQLGQGNTDDIGDTSGETTVAVDLGPGRTAAAVTAGSHHTCAVLDTGQLRCWGWNAVGQLGQGTTTNVGDTGHGTTAAVDLGAGRTALAVTAGDSHTCTVSDTRQLRCWGQNTSGQLGQGSAVDYGKLPGETPGALPAINLGGQLVGRDSDADGMRDAVDTCPTVAGLLTNGCAAVLKGKKVILDMVVAKRKASATCPAKASVKVKTKTKHGPVRVTRHLKTRTVAGGCRVKGKVRLGAKPRKTAKVKVTVTGKRLRTKRLVAVRL